MARVLIAPLDWGLGHATRSIPVIREFRRRGCAVFLAGSGNSLELLRQEFPELPVFQLPAYRPEYPAHGSMAITMARQLPHFIRVIGAEHKTINDIVTREGIDIIVSDNRYGCWSAAIPSIFITHQSNILMPRRFGWLQGLVRRISDHLINRFSECWIPDLPDNGQALAGDLVSFSRSRIRIPKVYIGWLSRFERTPGVARQYDVVAVFSGPEPQRTIFEDIVVPQLIASGLEFRVVRGLPHEQQLPADSRIVNFQRATELQQMLEAAHLVIARSGFSTVMDLHALEKKAVFVPTPGQTEQEYLAARLMDEGIAFSMSQDRFNLKEALMHSQRFAGFTNAAQNTLLPEAVATLLDHK